MIDLSRMKGIYVDPVNRAARAQGGVNWNEFNRAAALHGLAVTGGAVSTTGIAGLTLGGGLGWLMSSYGMAVDNVTSMEVITAEGEVLQASEDENPDLFWACRGGGGNFGVVSSFQYDLFPLAMVTGGLVAHPFSAAADVIGFYREFTAEVSDELTVFCGLVHAPDGSGAKLAAMIVCHTGTPEEAERDLDPLISFGEPAMVEVGRMPYPVINTLLDDGFPRGAHNYWKSAFLDKISDQAIETLQEQFARAPSPMTGIVLEHFHGQVTRIDPMATAFPHRVRGYNLLIPGQWMDPAESEENILWVKETYEALSPAYSGARYVNYLDDDEEAGAVRNAYGVVYDRLAEIKQRYDSDNIFRLNQNIIP